MDACAPACVCLYFVYYRRVYDFCCCNISNQQMVCGLLVVMFYVTFIDILRRSITPESGSFSLTIWGVCLSECPFCSIIFNAKCTYNVRICVRLRHCERVNAHREWDYFKTFPLNIRDWTFYPDWRWVASNECNTCSKSFAELHAMHHDDSQRLKWRCYLSQKWPFYNSEAIEKN